MTCSEPQAIAAVDYDFVAAAAAADNDDGGGGGAVIDPRKREDRRKLRQITEEWVSGSESSCQSMVPISVDRLPRPIRKNALAAAALPVTARIPLRLALSSEVSQKLVVRHLEVGSRSATVFTTSPTMALQERMSRARATDSNLGRHHKFLAEFWLVVWPNVHVSPL